MVPLSDREKVRMCAFILTQYIAALDGQTELIEQYRVLRALHAGAR